MNEDILIPGFFFLTVIVLAIGVPLVRARVRKMDHDRVLNAKDPQLDERLSRIEQAIDAVAVEVERVAEGQRFVTRLMSERPREPASLPRSASHPNER